MRATGSRGPEYMMDLKLLGLPAGSNQMAAFFNFSTYKEIYLIVEELSPAEQLQLMVLLSSSRPSGQGDDPEIHWGFPCRFESYQHGSLYLSYTEEYFNCKKELSSSLITKVINAVLPSSRGRG
ncbi:hypothetical protein AVEN_25861-1 [Araneus ventricosus]|uniref:Uncharacterized protein n=1 Tax=Araneus ventricosus TaxID=182803 RepID=A0A4Y2U6A3_ARAVE|nr:hypothetical protein AVEN_25861-1 [Araneus ventricosus]